MSATTYGLQTLTFGTPVITGFVTQSYSSSKTPANVIEIVDETGNRVAARYDDATEELSLEAIISGGTLPTVGGTFLYDTITWEVTGVDVTASNTDAVKASISGKKSEYIDASTP